VAQDNNMGKSQKILVQSFIINILTIFVYYSLSHQPDWKTEEFLMLIFLF
jgi:hypothetical protein